MRIRTSAIASALMLPLLASLAACATVDSKLTALDQAGDRLVVDYIDNSRINQSINASVDRLGASINDLLPGMLQVPPEERLAGSQGELAGSTEPGNGRQAAASPRSVTPNAAAAEDPAPARNAVSAASSAGDPRPAATGRRDNPLVVLDGVIVQRDMKTVQIGGRASTTSNIRMGPGTSHPVVRRVAAGVPLFATAVTRNGWYLLEEEGRVYGYISGTLFKRQR